MKGDLIYMLTFFINSIFSTGLYDVIKAGIVSAAKELVPKLQEIPKTQSFSEEEYNKIAEIIEKANKADLKSQISFLHYLQNNEELKEILNRKETSENSWQETHGVNGSIFGVPNVEGNITINYGVNKNIVEDNRIYKYDIALSFAGEDRGYVEKVADYLYSKGVRVFYDMYEQVELWGKDLYLYLTDIYKNEAQYCIIFISKHYKQKLWTSHEKKAAFARAFQSNTEYILPARFDDTEITGIDSTIGYIDLRTTAPKTLAEYAIKKLRNN